MTVRVLALQSGVTDLTGHRYHESAGFTQAGVGNARSGLIPTAGAGDVSQVSAMVVSVAGFAAWIDGTSSASQAGYNVVADAATSLTIADGEASVARTDRIWAVVHHDTFDSSGQTVGAVEYGKGQASGAPAAMPPSSILLYEFTVPAGCSAANGGVPVSSFVDKRTYTTAAGGILPIPSKAARDAITAPYKGLTIWRQDIGVIEVWHVNWITLGIPTIPSASQATTYISTPIDGQVFAAQDTHAIYMFDGGSGTWKQYAPEDVRASVAVAGTMATSSGTTEVAMASWGAGGVSSTFLFRAGHTYQIDIVGGTANSGTAGSFSTGTIRVRKGVATITGQQLLQTVVPSSTGSQVTSFHASGYIKNATGADISTVLGVTTARAGGGVASGNNLVYGDATTPLVVTVRHLGPTAEQSAGVVAAAVSVT